MKFAICDFIFQSVLPALLQALRCQPPSGTSWKLPGICSQRSQPGGGVPQRFMVVTLISIHSEWFWFYWWCVMLAWVMPYRVWIELRGLKRETAIVSFPSFLWLSCRPSSGSTWSSSPKCSSMTATLSAMCCFSHMWWMGQPEAINCQCQPRTGRV